MRQAEEWEQVIQGLQGPEQARVSVGAGGVWGCGAGQSGRVQPPPLAMGALGRWVLGRPAPGIAVLAAGHGWGERETLPPPTRCGSETEQAAGHNYRSGRKRRVGVRTGHIWVRSGDLTWVASTETPYDGFCSMKTSLCSQCVPHCHLPSLRTSVLNVPRWTRTFSTAPGAPSCPPQADHRTEQTPFGRTTTARHWDQAHQPLWSAAP